MNPQISGGTFDQFFAWAPWVVGIAIYFAFYVAKRHENESAGSGAVAVAETYACAGCGRRGPREQMVPQEHGGAVSWYCDECATERAAR
jgi:hypothetical protein